MTTTQDRRGMGLFGTAFGIVAGLVVYALFRGRASSTGPALPQDFDSLVMGGLLIYAGASKLFLRAAFPNRFQDTAPDRVRQAVTSASVVLAGYALVIRHGLTIPLGAFAIVAMVLARLRFPKSVFGPTL